MQYTLNRVSSDQFSNLVEYLIAIQNPTERPFDQQTIDCGGMPIVKISYQCTDNPAQLVLSLFSSLFDLNTNFHPTEYLSVQTEDGNYLVGLNRPWQPFDYPEYHSDASELSYYEDFVRVWFGDDAVWRLLGSVSSYKPTRKISVVIYV